MSRQLNRILTEYLQDGGHFDLSLISAKTLDVAKYCYGSLVRDRFFLFKNLLAIQAWEAVWEVDGQYSWRSTPPSSPLPRPTWRQASTKYFLSASIKFMRKIVHESAWFCSSFLQQNNENHGQSVSVTDILSLSQTFCVCHRHFISVTDILYQNVREFGQHLSMRFDLRLCGPLVVTSSHSL